MFNLGVTEIIVLVVLAILIFGPRLPHVAAEFAGWIVKLRRAMNDLRRESGIDREISEARREVENAIPRDVRRFDPARSLDAGVQSLKRDVAAPVVKELESARDAVMVDRREPTAELDESALVSPAAEDPSATRPAD